MIISKPPNKVYDEALERIYGRKPTNKDTDRDEAAEECDSRVNDISGQPKASPDGAAG